MKTLKRLARRRRALRRASEVDGKGCREGSGGGSEDFRYACCEAQQKKKKLGIN